MSEDPFDKMPLAKAREKVLDAKRMIADGVSPALEKQRAKRRLKEARDFAHVAQKWMDTAPMADSTRNRLLFEPMIRTSPRSTSTRWASARRWSRR